MCLHRLWWWHSPQALPPADVPWPQLHLQPAILCCRQHDGMGCTRLHHSSVQGQGLAAPQNDILLGERAGRGLVEAGRHLVQRTIPPR